MRIQCNSCETAFDLDLNRIEGNDANVQCYNCGAVFTVQKGPDNLHPGSLPVRDASDQVHLPLPGHKSSDTGEWTSPAFLSESGGFLGRLKKSSVFSEVASQLFRSLRSSRPFKAVFSFQPQLYLFLSTVLFAEIGQILKRIGAHGVPQCDLCFGKYRVLKIHTLGVSLTKLSMSLNCIPPQCDRFIPDLTFSAKDLSMQFSVHSRYGEVVSKMDVSIQSIHAPGQMISCQSRKVMHLIPTFGVPGCSGIFSNPILPHLFCFFVFPISDHLLQTKMHR